MRYIAIDTLLPEIFADVEGRKIEKRLARAHKKVANMPLLETRKKYVADNGSGKWKQVKDRLTSQLGKKCWYTEVELIGAPLAIDHYRPVSNYWWLAFDAQNYRVACPWANSPEHNALHGCAGGKGDNFPLLSGASRATEKSQLANEQPVILDPCSAADCALLTFRADGRPDLHPDFAADQIAKQRVEASMILLNLDLSDFNTKREQLYYAIENDVQRHEELPKDSAQRALIRGELALKLGPQAPFSTAARFHLQNYRYLDWVQKILDAP